MSQVRLLKLASAAICMAALAAGPAQADTITFNADTTGFKPNSFVSASNPDVSFSDTVGTRLMVLDATPLGVTGQALGVDNDQYAQLRMDFAATMTSLSVTYGNDDENWMVPGDRAWLVLYNGATAVASVYQDLNMNSAIDQTISYSGGPDFNRAQFYFGDTGGAANLGSEVVSSISFQRAPVSEPGSLAILGAGLLGLGLVQQRRKAGRADA